VPYRNHDAWCPATWPPAWDSCVAFFATFGNLPHVSPLPELHAAGPIPTMPDAPAPSVSVVVPHYNDLQNLASCLESLRRQTFPRGRFEVIVADNNSPGGVATVERIAPDITVVPAPEQGAGPARNAGAAAARGSHLAFVDSDCVADENWLREGIAALERLDYVGGRVITTVRDTKRLTPAEAFEAVFAFDFEKYIHKDKFAGSGNLFVPKGIFEQVGGFRAGVAEDIDWCHRANAMGFRLGYAERAIVYHAARREWSALTKRWDRVMIEMIRLAMERPGWRLRWAVYAATVALSPFAHWLPIMLSPRLVGLRAKGRGLFGLLQIRSYRSYRMMCLLVNPPE
jgi:GT2 family glycosyltransferase